MHVGPQCTFSLCQCRSRKKSLYGRPTDTILNTYVHNIRCIAMNPLFSARSRNPSAVFCYRNTVNARRIFLCNTDHIHIPATTSLLPSVKQLNEYQLSDGGLSKAGSGVARNSQWEGVGVEVRLKRRKGEVWGVPNPTGEGAMPPPQKFFFLICCIQIDW